MKMVLERQRAKALAEAKKIVAACTTENRGMTDVEQEAVQTFTAQAETFTKQLELHNRLTNADAVEIVQETLQMEEKPTQEDAVKELASERRWLMQERVYAHKPRYCASRREAFNMGMFMLATVFKRESAAKRCKQLGIQLTPSMIQNEGTNAAGAFLIPEQFEATMIDLRETFGVFRSLTRIIPMQRDTLEMPRRTGGLTAYFPAEQGTITESTKGWDRVSATAKKMAAMVRYTNELGEDAAINIGDDLAGEIAYAFANKEDDCGFNGDGTSTYGRILGLRTRLRAPGYEASGSEPTIANIAGLQVASGTGYATNYASIALADFHGVIARLPQYADTPGVCWIVHRSFYYNVMQKLAFAAGGVTAEEIIGGKRRPMFLGYPVVFSQIMPKVSAVSQVCVLFGDISRGTFLGDRRQLAIETSREATVGSVSTFETDETAIRGQQRLDIVCHDVGNSSATASLQVAGPIVGLITAAS